LDERADIQNTSPHGRLPLHEAVRRGHIPMVDRLLQAGATVSERDSNGLQALHHLASSSAHLAMAKHLLKLRADVHARSEEGISPLQSSMYSAFRDTGLLELLLQSGAADVDSMNDVYEALVVASYRGHLKVVQTLVDEVHAPFGRPKTDEIQPLHAAAMSGHLPVVEFLMAKNAPVNAMATRFQKATPLHGAVQWCNREVAKYLAQHGADLLVPGLLNPAVHRGCADVVHDMLQLGAKVGALDETGSSLLHTAARGGHVPVAQILLRKRARVDYADPRQQMQPLHMAAAKGHLAVSKLLVEHRADVWAQAAPGDPLRAAKQGGNAAVVKFIRRLQH